MLCQRRSSFTAVPLPTLFTPGMSSPSSPHSALKAGRLAGSTPNFVITSASLHGLMRMPLGPLPTPT